MADYNVNKLLYSQTYLSGEENSSLEHVIKSRYLLGGVGWQAFWDFLWVLLVFLTL